MEDELTAQSAQLGPTGAHWGSSPVVSGVPDGPLAAQPVALLQVEGMLPVGVVAWPQLLGHQVGLVIKGAQQVALRLCPWRLRHLQGAPRTHN